MSTLFLKLRLSSATTTKLDPADLVSRLCRTISAWRARAVARRQLAALTAWQLRDIGVSAGEANVEAQKPFWRN